MTELLIAGAILTLVWVVVATLTVRTARRRSRARAERMLDLLAAEACEALAVDDRSRRSRRALARYDRLKGRVAAARTCHELEAAIARDRLRLAARDLADQGAELARDLLAEAASSMRRRFGAAG